MHPSVLSECGCSETSAPSTQSPVCESQAPGAGPGPDWGPDWGPDRLETPDVNPHSPPTLFLSQMHTISSTLVRLKNVSMNAATDALRQRAQGHTCPSRPSLPPCENAIYLTHRKSAAQIRQCCYLASAMTSCSPGHTWDHYGMAEGCLGCPHAARSVGGKH
uniref:Uncharacterized protein n=1 Tax=Knipowitschia caucasica TaxID=637954 RepID=A0AAV2KQG1_KNICA